MTISTCNAANLHKEYNICICKTLYNVVRDYLKQPTNRIT